MGNADFYTFDKIEEEYFGTLVYLTSVQLQHNVSQVGLVCTFIAVAVIKYIHDDMVLKVTYVYTVDLCRDICESVTKCILTYLCVVCD